jgi:hypothetical protein
MHSMIHFSPIQRSKGNSMRARVAYQSSTAVNDGVRRADYSRYAEHHVGGVILLPAGASPAFAYIEKFVAAITSRETRWDAQEGMAVDFAIPRQVPDHLLLAVAAFALLPFVERGMALRVDVECPLASDGLRNPHAHACLALRFLEAQGFGPKAREWIYLFWLDKLSHVRSIVAARITLACAIFGIDAFVDPRRNEERGAGTPEPRLPPKLVRMHNSGKTVERVNALHEGRRLRIDRKASELADDIVASGARIKSAVTCVWKPKAKERARRLREQFCALALQEGYQPEGTEDENSVLSLVGTGVAFDGEVFTLGTRTNDQDVKIVALFARHFGWPALVVEGEACFADMVAVAAAREGLFIVNRSVSDATRRVISETYFEEFKSAISIYDPRGIVSETLSGVSPYRAIQADCSLQLDLGDVEKSEEALHFVESPNLPGSSDDESFVKLVRAPYFGEEELPDEWLSVAAPLTTLTLVLPKEISSGLDDPRCVTFPAEQRPMVKLAIALQYVEAIRRYQSGQRIENQLRDRHYSGPDDEPGSPSLR